ncbi:MAG: OmpA family protein [Planctomycetes bacterium]|nr:OmpA family protein [Planctomycetota bacterium]
MSKPKPGFYIVAFLIVVGLIGFAIFKFNDDSKKNNGQEPKFTPDEMSSMQTPVEEPSGTAVTTVKEYEWVAAQRLPEVKGISAYQPMQDRTVRFAINVWAGWGPIILANNGFKPEKQWTTPTGEPFKVQLVLIDDPIAMRDAYAAGEVHIGWGTLDMVPLFMEALRKDSRVMPRIFQQVDWSNGGDGIVVRDSIKTMSDLRGKTVVLAQNSPSHFFLLNALINSGVQPSEVDMRFTQDAFQAAAAFNADKSIAGCVSWAPDIYNLSEVKGNKMLVTSATANKLIADVWFARADFAKDHADVIEGLVRGIFDAMLELKTDAGKQTVARLMADGYSIPADECLGMLGDAHSTNYAENREFFLNQNNPTNFERTWNTAYFLYKRIGQVSKKTAFDEVMDFSVIKKLGNEPKYADQRVEYGFNFVPVSATAYQVEDPILTKTVVIQFFPNSWDIQKRVMKKVDGEEKEVLYDPNAAFVIEEVGKLAGQYGAARIIIEGHTDASMRGKVSPQLVKDLAEKRANSVKEAIVNQFPTLQPDQFSPSGVGWDRPADPNDPENHAKNRRVEIKVYPAEVPK